MIKRRSITAALSGCIALLGVGRRASHAQSTTNSVRPSAMTDGMMGGRSMREMMSHGNMTGPMRLGMELFERHMEIARTTEHLPDGVVDTTVSSDPGTAKLIQAHVIEMYGRLAVARPFPYPMSNSVLAMFANSTNYRRSYKRLPTGIQVTETSDDPNMVEVIQAHARELDRFARDGMPAMMRTMMGRPG